MVSIPYAWSTPSPHHARESFSKSFKMRRGDGKMTLQKLIISSGRNSLKFGLRYKTCPPYHAPGIPEFQFFLTVCHILPEGLSTVEANQVLTSAQDAIVRDGDGINYSLRLP